MCQLGVIKSHARLACRFVLLTTFYAASVCASVAQCTSYVPDPSSFPYSFSQPQTINETTTAPDGTSTSQSFTQGGSNRVRNPYDYIGQTGLSQADTFTLCVGKPLFTGSGIASSPASASSEGYTDYVSLTVANGTISIFETGTSTQPPADGNTYISFSATFINNINYVIQTGAFHITSQSQAAWNFYDPNGNNVIGTLTSTADVSGGWQILPSVSITTRFLSPSFAETGQQYTASVSASGGQLPYRWFLTNSPPAGLGIDIATGVISGVPTEPSGDLPMSFTDPGVPTGFLGSDLGVQVSDANAASDQKVFKLYVSGRPIKQRLTPAEKDAFFLKSLKEATLVAAYLALLATPECEVAPPCVAFASAQVDGLAPLAVADYLNSLDPSDSAYTKLALPPLIPVRFLEPKTGISRAQAAAVNKLLLNLVSQASLRWAIYTSINRAQGALDAGVQEWELKQIQWAKHYSIFLASLIDNEKALRTSESAIIGSYAITDSDIAGLANLVAMGQLPDTVSNLLSQSGFSALDVLRITNLLTSADWHNVPQKLLSGLTDPTLDTSEASSSRALRSFVADINGDLQVSCSDVAIVENALGKYFWQIGYDVRGDVNADGVVNHVDRSYVVSQLPLGTKCWSQDQMRQSQSRMSSSR